MFYGFLLLLLLCLILLLHQKNLEKETMITINSTKKKRFVIDKWICFVSFHSFIHLLIEEEPFFKYPFIHSFIQSDLVSHVCLVAVFFFISKNFVIHMSRLLVTEWWSWWWSMSGIKLPNSIEILTLVDFKVWNKSLFFSQCIKWKLNIIMLHI